ncbi:MAG: DUF2892 domain-containing protein [Bacteroidota bacterium]
METNMARLDAYLRILVAIVIGSLAYTGFVTGTLAVVLLILAIVFLLTGIIGTCPLYTLFGVRTCSRKG